MEPQKNMQIQEVLKGKVKQPIDFGMYLGLYIDGEGMMH